MYLNYICLCLSSFYIYRPLISSVSTLSSFSADSRSWNSPFIATDIDPVSSETTMTTASASCDMPMAARCLSPKSLGISILWDTGRMHPADRKSVV